MVKINYILWNTIKNHKAPGGGGAGTWVAPLIECLTLGFSSGHDGSQSPGMGPVWAQHLAGSLLPTLPLCPSPAMLSRVLSLRHSYSRINK